MGTEAKKIGTRRLARLLGMGFAGLLLVPMGAWAAGPSIGDTGLTAAAPGDGATLTLVGTTVISDQELATETGQGIVKPHSSAGQNIQGPQVTLWDDVERPGTTISIGAVNAATNFTSSVWH